MGTTTGSAVRDDTVGSAIAGAARQLEALGIENARLEAEVLVADAFVVDRAHLLARLREPLPPPAAARFEGLLARRLRREPLAYITGTREFYGIDISCGPGALIPRPESELLVEIAVAEIRCRPREALWIADIGTGTGAVAIAIATHAPSARVVGVDREPAALAIARQNVHALGLASRIALLRGDLLSGVGVVDIVVGNLPYVRDGDWRSLAPEIRDNEPREALVGGARGVEVIERLLERAPAHLAPGGLLALESGDGQAAAVSAAARRVMPAADISVQRDLAGRDRVLVARPAVEETA
ncbi:MAG: peptide chain release factor N(5)-glutamine methyltransferase [Dehalococcoidia bacterium]